VATLNSASVVDAPVLNESASRPAREQARRTLGGGWHRVPAPHSRVGYTLGITTVCALVVVNLMGVGPAATASPQERSASTAVASALGIDGSGVDESALADPQLLTQLSASRSQRDAEQAAAADTQAQAEQVAAAARAEAEARAAAEAAAEAAKAAAAVTAADVASPAAVAASTAAIAIARITNSSGPVRPQAQAAANVVVSNVPGVNGITIGGTRASAADPHGHPSGLALDYMVGSNAGLGDAIVAYHVAHWDELGVEYIIWQQRMLSSPSGSWQQMENRGSPTANHMDHPHVNYRG
jgi:hypothetical protein